MINIHPTAIVSKKAKLADGCFVGPYTIIEDPVIIGEGTRILNHCTIKGNTTIGARCNIFTGAVIGSIPQDLKYKGEESYLSIGDDNIIREFVTINLSTEKNTKTEIGNNNLLMAYSHVAHDCKVGNGCVIANNGTLAGHVTLEDKAVIGGLVAIHQFVRIGTLSIIGGCSKVVQDIPPYSTCDGHPAKVFGINIVGLKRADFPKETITVLKHAFKILFFSQISIPHALEKIEKEITGCKEVSHLVDFVKASERGITR
ncbi:MAG: acyl-ACP--UDP-N-acetylglucosamine O-acyltransferase [Candidatus Omnitrophota bacterium]